MRRNANREKLLFVPPVTMIMPEMVWRIIPSNKVLRKEIEKQMRWRLAQN